MAELEFEDILPFVEGEGDTGRTAREKINRNFDKIKPIANVGAEMQQLRQDVEGDIEQLHNDVEEMVDKATSLFGYYNCSTAGATVAKTVQVTGYELTTGGNIRIKMEHANTAASPVTLQIGNATAKELYYNGEPVTDENTWEDGEVITVYYDGTRYQSQINKGGITDADFVESNVEDGGIYTDGSVSTSDWCHNKEYIPVSEGDIIRWRSGNAFSANDANRLNNVLCYYDSNFARKNYFTYIQKDRVLSGSTEIVPADVAYIKASFRKENGYGIDIKHSGESDFTAVFAVETTNGKYKDIHKIPAMEELLEGINDNLYIKTNVAPGGFAYNTGAVTNSDWCHCVDYIPVSPGDALIWKAGNTIIEGENRFNNTLIVYDANKQMLTYYVYNAVNRSITIPANVSYIRASFPNEDGYSIEVNGVTVFTTVATTKDKVQEAANNAADAKELAENVSERLFDYSTVYSEIGYYYGKSGATTSAIFADEQWGISVNIPCQYNDIVTISAPSGFTQNTSPQRTLHIYDTAGNFITYFVIYSSRNISLTNAAYTNAAYIRMSVRLADADKFTIKVNGELRYTGVIVNSLEGNVYEKVKEMIDEYVPTPEGGSSDNHISYMPLYGFENKTVDSGFNTVASNKAVCTSVMQMPYKGVCFDIKFPDAIKCKIQYGTITSSGMSSSISDVDTPRITTPFNASTEIRFAFLKKDNSNVTPEEIQALVDSGEISIGYENHTPNVVRKNIACESYTKAVMCKWILNGLNTSYKNIPVFAHFSDLHGDVVRLKNIMEYCKYLGVDAVLNTGDTVQNRAINGMTTYHEIVGGYDIPTLICVGNHDAWYDGDSRTDTQNEKLYADAIQPNSVDFGYTLPVAADYDNAATYYYRDFASLNIRVISVNLYEQNIGYWAYYGRISQRQIDWLIATLASTPADYGVIIMTHTNTDIIDRDANHPDFYDVSRPNNYQGNIDEQIKLTGDPIGKIVDAFISGILYSGSYTQAISGNTTETISYEADFTSLNGGVEFICYVSGHHHADFIGYFRDATNRQLALNVTTAQSLYGRSKAGDGDLIRGGQGATEDAFNIYGIDRVAGTVKIARVGANMTSRLTERKYMEIPYRDNS